MVQKRNGKRLPAGQNGFTIVETLIVLAVTSALFVSAMFYINGRQNRTEFMTGVNSLQQQIQQVINETESGYFPNNNTFTCMPGNPAVPSQPTLTAGAAAGQGTNNGCAFLGKVIQFGAADAPDQTVVHSLAGNAAGATLLQAYPKDIDPYLRQMQKLQYGLRIQKMTYTAASGASGLATSGAGFIAADPSGNIFTKNVASGQYNSGAETFSLFAIKLSSVNSTTISTMVSNLNGSAANYDPATQIDICAVSSGSNQLGIITIGDSASNNQLRVSMRIMSTSVCP